MIRSFNIRILAAHNPLLLQGVEDFKKLLNWWTAPVATTKSLGVMIQRRVNGHQNFETVKNIDMTEEQKWNYINKLDEELLLGGVILLEWRTFLVKDAQIAFCSGAYLASILASQSAIDSHLRYDFFNPNETKVLSFYDLIEKLKRDLHDLRKYRNKWTHVHDSGNDNELLGRPEFYEAELADISKTTIRTLLKVIYSNPRVMEKYLSRSL